MHLDVIIPTRNRSRLLARAIESLLAAPAPPGLHVRILVVNNGSTDATPALLEWMMARHRGRIAVINERRRWEIARAERGHLRSDRRPHRHDR
jgi:glucosyl-dolichyl phosphate glucuronosyltransferase